MALRHVLETPVLRCTAALLRRGDACRFGWVVPSTLGIAQGAADTTTDAAPSSSSSSHLSATYLWSPIPNVGSLAGFAKGAERSRGGKSSVHHKISLSLDLAPEEAKMKKAVEQLQEDMSRLHCGRPQPGLLDPIMVLLPSGERCALRSLGTVSVRNRHLMVVAAHSVTDLESIAKAIRTSALQMQARVEGKEILVPLPRPSAQVVKQLIKQLHTEAEQARMKIRTVRRTALEDLEGQLESADEKRQATRLVQDLHDKYLNELNAVVKAKEADLKAAGSVGDI